VAPVTLAVVSNDLEAEMLCGELRANGIACSYEKTGMGTALGSAVTAGGPTAILVDEKQLEEASRFLPDTL
jgi:Putative prokaryotic signal transducing protein